MLLSKIKKELRIQASPTQAKILQRFFKTGKGEYGEGDKFIGISVPNIRKLAKTYRDLPLSENQKLIKSPIHEERFLAIIILTLNYEKASLLGHEQKCIYRYYLKNMPFINNWDLVDISAPKIIGHYIYHTKQKKLLEELSKSKSLWKRRMAMLATFYFIRKNSYSETLQLAKKYLHDKEDLIHKATGWMLREIGKRDQETEERFLQNYYKHMPRTMLRYAIEKFDKAKRDMYLKSLI